MKVVNAKVPLSEMFGYITDLRTITSGRTAEQIAAGEIPEGIIPTAELQKVMERRPDETEEAYQARLAETQAEALPLLQIIRYWLNQADADLSLSIGEIIGLPQEQLLSAAVYTYIWPLIGLIIGALLAQWLSFPHELYQVCFAFIGAYTGFSLAKIKQSQLSKRQIGWLQPKILRKACDTIPVKQVI